MGYRKSRWLGKDTGYWPVSKHNCCFPGCDSICFSAHQEKVIPSVVIEPASNHEGEGEHHETTVGATEDVASQGQAGETQELVAEATPLDSQAAMAAPGGAGDSSMSAEDAAQDVPPGFLYKVFVLSRQGHCR